MRIGKKCKRGTVKFPQNPQNRKTRKTIKRYKHKRVKGGMDSPETDDETIMDRHIERIQQQINILQQQQIQQRHLLQQRRPSTIPPKQRSRSRF
jgi:hypothetical protein